MWQKKNPCVHMNFGRCKLYTSITAINISRPGAPAFAAEVWISSFCVAERLETSAFCLEQEITVANTDAKSRNDRNRFFFIKQVLDCCLKLKEQTSEDNLNVADVADGVIVFRFDVTNGIILANKI